MPRFIFSIWTQPLRLPILAHIGLTVASVLAFRSAKAWLDASYAASRHPVDFVTGQTGFDATLVKGYYEYMSQLGTLDIYVRTQIIDFAFILAFAVMGWMIGMMIARAGHPRQWGHSLGLAGGAAIVAGTLMDAAENAMSFIMLANPDGFADWLALIYSGFAVAKFGLITLGMALLAASLIFSVIARLRSLISHQSSTA